MGGAGKTKINLVLYSSVILIFRGICFGMCFVKKVKKNKRDIYGFYKKIF